MDFVEFKLISSIQSLSIQTPLHIQTVQPNNDEIQSSSHCLAEQKTLKTKTNKN